MNISAQAQEYANRFNCDAHSVQSLMDFIIERVGDKVTAENVHDVVQAYTPEWLRLQESMAGEALTKMHIFAPMVRDLIKREAA